MSWPESEYVSVYLSSEMEMSNGEADIPITVTNIGYEVVGGSIFQRFRFFYAFSFYMDVRKHKLCCTVHINRVCSLFIDVMF